jgi:ubiquinone/menaquinone biosynthesis C-methylase UbiE
MISRSEPQSADADGLRHSYDREAERYDEHRYHSAEGRLFSELEIAVLRSCLELSQGAKILDIPAGTGRLSFPVSATLGATVIGADISRNMLRVADAKREAGNTVHFTQASGTQLPFRDDTFDAVLSFKFFHLVPNDRKRLFIREMARVLKPGKPLVVEFNSPFYGGILATIRYYFRKKHPGGMRMKCIFPDQISDLFAGLEVRTTRGVKLPLSGYLVRIVGRPAVEALELGFGRLPGIKYLTYAIIVEARKPAATAR